MRDLDRIWQAIRGTDNNTASETLQSVIPQLINRYGLMAAAVAADWYEALTGTEAFLPDSYNEEAFQTSTRWALGPLFQKEVSEADRKTALKRLTAAAVRHTRQHARNTIDGSVRRSGGKVRYARRVTGATTCDFCLMLASRGPVYGTVEDAGGASNRYHDNCDCVPVPVVGRWVVDDSIRGAHWEGQNPGYDFEELYEKEYLPYHHAGDTPEDVMERRRAVLRQAKQAEKRNTRKASLDGTLQREKWDAYRSWVENQARLKGIVIDGEEFKLPPKNWEEPPDDWPQDLPLLRAKEWNHILYGDKKAGGHSSGYGWIHNKTEFDPETTSEVIAEKLKALLRRIDYSGLEKTKQCTIRYEDGNIYNVYLSNSHGTIRVTSFHRLEKVWRGHD
jgi:hypothetical protein|nr:MAG TPA: minor capsid protein [Caudoviricetes sp.]